MQLSNDIINKFIFVGIGFEVLTALLGLYFLTKRRKDKILKYFVFFICYVAINELVGLYIKLNEGINAIIHNIYSLINFSFFFIIYMISLSNRFFRKLIISFFIFYIIIFIINGFFENYLNEYQRLPYIIGALFLIVTIFLYYIELLNSEKVLNAKKDLLFWISVGLLIYYVGNLPFRIMRNYYSELTDATILFLVSFSLTLIMNSCFIIGFIWSDKKQPY